MRFGSTIFGLVILAWSGFALAEGPQTIEELIKFKEQEAITYKCQFELAGSIGLFDGYLNPRMGYGPFLEKSYCERMRLKAFQSPFDEGEDAPPDASPPWRDPSDVMKVLLKNSNTGLDIKNLVDLNKQASELWDKLIVCHGTAEKARRAYYTLDAKCGLNTEIKNLSVSTAAYLSTTYPTSSKESAPFWFHPLFVQLLLENATATTWIPAITDLGDEGLRFLRGRVMNLVVSGHTIEDLRNSTHHGEALEIQELEYLPANQDKMLERVMIETYRQLNSVHLLEANPSNLCESLGLWPGVSRLMTFEIAKDFNIRQLGADAVATRYAALCGDLQYTTSPYGGRVHASKKIIVDFLHLSTRFESTVKK